MATRKERAQQRQAGDYKVPIVSTPKEKKPIPVFKPSLKIVR
jgi:hypothetical protein